VLGFHEFEPPASPFPYQSVANGIEEVAELYTLRVAECRVSADSMIFTASYFLWNLAAIAGEKFLAPMER